MSLKHVLRGLSQLTLLFLIIVSGCDSNKSVTPGTGATTSDRWVLQSPQPTDRALFSVYFVDENTGWIAGSGIILHTADGGATWIKQIQNDNESYRDISFADKNNGWAVGNYNVIRHTVDGGKTWTKQESGIDALKFTSIAVHDSLKATAVGWRNIVVQTFDGGKSWVQRTTDANTYQDAFEKLYFHTPAKGLITGQNGTILYSNDSGRTWSVSHGSTSGPAVAMVLFDSLDGRLCTSQGNILRTVNGGLNWFSLYNTYKSLNSMSFVDRLHGWAAGPKGSILYTEDGGTSWSTQQSGVDDELYDIYFLNTQIGWAVGVGGIILKTINGGQNWKRMSKEILDNLLAADFAGFHGWAAGQKGAILSTRNDGATWEVQNSPTSEQINDLDFVDAYHGWAVGDRGVILHTDNGGQVWSQQQSSVSVHFSKLQFLDQNVGWIVGSPGSILKTTDGGDNWNVQYSDPSIDLHSVFFLNPTEGWASGVGLVLHTTDGGATWETVSNSKEISDAPLRDIVFLNSSEGFAVSDIASLFSTSDGGKTWIHSFLKFRDYYVYATLYSIEFVDDQFGWIVGEEMLGRQGVIYFTRDGGKTWTNDDFITANGLYDVKFNNRREGWIVGENGMIIHTEQGDR